MPQAAESLTQGPAGAQGPTGATGPAGPEGPAGTGVNILGTLANQSDLPATGSPREGYLISGDLWVWSATTSTWVNVGKKVRASTELLRTLSPHLAELLRTLPPQLPVPKACEVRQCSRAHIYDLLGMGRVRGVKDGRSLRIDTESLLADMAGLPAAEIKPSARLQSRLSACTAAENAPHRRDQPAEKIETRPRPAPQLQDTPRPRGRRPRKSQTATTITA